MAPKHVRANSSRASGDRAACRPTIRRRRRERRSNQPSAVDGDWVGTTKPLLGSGSFTRFDWSQRPSLAPTSSACRFARAQSRSPSDRVSLRPFSRHSIWNMPVLGSGNALTRFRPLRRRRRSADFRSRTRRPDSSRGPSRRRRPSCRSARLGSPAGTSCICGRHDEEGALYERMAEAGGLLRIGQRTVDLVGAAASRARALGRAGRHHGGSLPLGRVPVRRDRTRASPARNRIPGRRPGHRGLHGGGLGRPCPLRAVARHSVGARGRSDPDGSRRQPEADPAPSRPSPGRAGRYRGGPRTCRRDRLTGDSGRSSRARWGAASRRLTKGEQMEYELTHVRAFRNSDRSLGIEFWANGQPYQIAIRDKAVLREIRAALELVGEVMPGRKAGWIIVPEDE